MLRWLVVLAMALLPWHGWAGAGVAAAPQAGDQHALHAAAAASGDASHHHGQSDADCLGDAGTAADHHAATGTDGGCPGCSMCHSCSPVALPGMAGVPDGDAAPRLQPATSVSHFASAERLPGLKPPIS